MKLTNAMEAAVKAHLTRIRQEFPAEDGVCWCPLCRADAMALALSSLAPSYGTRRPLAVTPGSTLDAAVADEVSRAVRKVALFPKHPTGAAVAAGDPVFVVNFPLEESFRVVDEMMGPEGESCGCWDCRCDAVAFALNRYPARYGVEHRGETHLRESDRALMRGEIRQFLELALSVVAAVPRHEPHPVG